MLESFQQQTALVIFQSAIGPLPIEPFTERAGDLGDAQSGVLVRPVLLWPPTNPVNKYQISWGAREAALGNSRNQYPNQPKDVACVKAKRV